MNFIALIVALFLERLLGDRERLREPHWYHAYAAWLQRVLGSGTASGSLGVLLLVAPPVALVGVVYALLGGALLSLLALLFSIAVLLMCLGPRELDAEASRYVDAIETGNDALADALAHDLAGPTVPAGGATRNRAVARAILLEFNRRTFAVAFWFVVLGPMGAVLYRLTLLARGDVVAGRFTEPDFAAALLRLQGILEWVPARMIALGFALVGSFEDAITDWRAYHARPSGLFWEVNDDVITATGRGALRLGDATPGDDGNASAGIGAVRAALALTLRTLIFWLALYGLLTIAGFAV